MARKGVVLIVLGLLGLVLANAWAQRHQVPGRAAVAQAKKGETPENQVPANQQPPSLLEEVGKLLDSAAKMAPEQTQDELEDLQGQLAEADRTWRGVKAQMRHGVNGLNRQLRTNRHDCPNIILIVADDLGYGDLGCYGQQRIQTPNIDRLAAEGARYTNYYAGGPLDIPSRCSLMTGKHTGHAALRANTPVPLPAVEVTVAEVLWKAGYTTGFMGRWFLGDQVTPGAPAAQGFDHFFGNTSLKRSLNHFPEFVWRNARIDVSGNQQGQKTKYVNDLVTQRALDFLRAARRQPFFLVFSYDVPSENVEVPSDAPYSNQKWTRAQKNYAAMITRMDRDVGRMIRQLDVLGLSGNTVVFFTNDNGPKLTPLTRFFNSNGGLRGGKGLLYEGGIRAPMIVHGPRAPGRPSKGRVDHRPWAAWDFLLTAADIAGAWRRPRNTDGISQLPQFQGRTQSDAPYLYWETLEGGVLRQAIRQGKWKGVRLKPAAPLELYDLEADRGEKNNVAVGNPAVVKELEELLEQARTAP